MKKRLFTLLMIAALLALPACGAKETGTAPTAGGTDSGGVIQLDFWYSLGGDTGKVVEEMVQQFNASQSGIKVTPVYQGDYAALMAKIYSAVTSGALPHVAQVGAAPILSTSGAVVPIGDFAAGAKGIDLSALRPAFLQYNTSGGKLWSMPFNNSVPVMYYNKDLFKAAGLDPEKPPQSFSELVDMAAKLTLDPNKTGTPTQYGLNSRDDTHWFLSTMLLGNGASIVNSEETEALYNSPEAVEMLALWGAMVNEDKIMPPNQHEEAQTDFLAGKLAMFWGSSAAINSIKSGASFDLGVAVFPQVGEKPRAIPIGGGSLVIFKNEDQARQDASWEFVKYMTSVDSSKYLSTRTGYLPIYQDAMNWPEITDLVAKEPFRKAVIDSLNYAVSIPVFSAIGNSDLALRQAVEKVELGVAQPQEALDVAVTSTNRSIADLSAQE